jgi:serine/alanine adding enzyme
MNAKRSMKVVIELDRQKWSAFVYSHPNGNVFLTPEMHDVYKRTKNYQPFAVGVLNDAEELLAVLSGVIQREYDNIFGGFTARAIISGGPLVKEGEIEALELLLQEYESLVGNSVLYTQIRNLWTMVHLKSILEGAKYAYEDHLDIMIDISRQEDEIWKNIDRKKRNRIRRAVKLGIYVRELVEVNDIDGVYAILSDVYDYAKLPLVDKTMFVAAFEILRPLGWCKFFGAFSKETLVGTMCVLPYKQCVYAWYSGSRPEYLNMYPNDLIPWEVFKWGRNNGYTKFDFGGAGKPGEKYGVRDYKKKFGGELVNFGRFQKVHKPLKYTLAKVGFNTWRFLKARIPVAVR